MNKVCPLMSMLKYKFRRMFVNCVKEKCALWIEESKSCSIKNLGQIVYENSQQKQKHCIRPDGEKAFSDKR